MSTTPLTTAPDRPWTAGAPSATPAEPGLAGTAGLYAAVVLSWGFSWIALKAQLGVVAPEVSILWRFLLAAAIMLAWVRVRGEAMRFSRQVHLRLAGVGACMFSLNFVLFYYGGLTIPSGLLAVVFSLASIINLALGALVMGQRIEPRLALGGAVGVTGVGLLFWPQIAGAGLDRGALAGLGLCVVGTLLFCTGNLLSGAIQRRGVPLLAANAWGMIYGVGVLALLVLVRGQPLAIELTPRYLGALLFLAVVASVVAFSAYVGLLRRIGAARAGYATVLFPLVALLVSTVLEGYVWTPLAAIGAACALAGNVLVLTAPRRA